MCASDWLSIFSYRLPMYLIYFYVFRFRPKYHQIIFFIIRDICWCQERLKIKYQKKNPSEKLFHSLQFKKTKHILWCIVICCYFKKVLKINILNFNGQMQWNILYLLSKDQRRKMLPVNILKNQSEIALSELVVSHFKWPCNHLNIHMECRGIYFLFCFEAYFSKMMLLN